MNTKSALKSDSPTFISQRVSEARRYYLNLKPARDSALVVVCGGVERCSPDYEICRSTFPYAGIEFVAEGLGTLELSKKTYPLRPGTLFAYAPGIPHRIRNNPRTPMLKYYVDFAGKEARSLLKASPLGSWKAIQVSSPGDISDVFELLHRNGAIPTTYTPEICMHLVSLLLLKISELAVPFGIVETRAFPTYQRIRRYIETHYSELHTVEAVAAACHVDVSYLCRLFQRFGRHTPYQLLLRLKMDRAATLLIEEDMPVKTVAATLGFSDPFHFSRAFKRLYGLAPAVFVEQGRRNGR
jgi:AraC-like DNA-binding protein